MSKLQPTINEFIAFSDPCKLEKARWIRMVRSRFWSTFSYFTDDELEAGIKEMEAKYAVGCKCSVAVCFLRMSPSQFL